MKWNWGFGLVFSMLCFMGFIMFLVITMSVNKKFDHDLVVEDYYAKEIVYQTEIDAEKNTKALSRGIFGQKSDKGWVVVFPDELNDSKVKGKVFLYRPSNQQLDFDIPLVISNSNLLIPDSKLLDGRWNITISFSYQGKDYLYKDQIVY